MKHRVFSTILSLLCLLAAYLAGALAPVSFRASAEELPQSGDYACVLQEGVFFYAAPDESRGLFLLPATYYVKLLDHGGEYCRVEYLYDDGQAKRLVGYVKTASLTFVDYLPEQPYFYRVFSLHYRIDETLSPSDDFLNEITVDCAYYGDYKIGSKTYCYVLRGDSFGYVPKPADLIVPVNTEYEEYLASIRESSTEETPSEKENSSPAQIAILIALCLLVPVLAALILKPPRRPPYDLDPE